MSQEPSEAIHPVQALLDNPWALLVLGTVGWALSYTMWGWYELANLPPATLP